MADTRTVDATGHVYQEGYGGPRLIGQLHRQPSGRWHVVMLGRRVAMRLRSREAAVRVAMEWQPEPGLETELLPKLLDPRLP